MNELACCGLECGACEFRAKGMCAGCRAAGGKLFWGACDIARCVLGRGLAHCGKCADFPCDLLKSFSYDPAHGDNGERIERLRGAA